MTYVLITKIEKFTDKKDDAQNTANLWYQSLVNKLQDFNAFKLEFLKYFSNNNSINCLANTFITIKQGDTKAAIQADYFTVPQILNQFIYGLHSSILQHICSLHLTDFQAAVTNVRDFKAIELKTNHA
ncbi:hypothetical protein G9A89_004528 [Geosiphon pyriformis]|nr:hypothetical protein G9A89_004528 [Geosiphon pyriformis]